MFENEECVAERRIQNVHLFGCYWISSEILTLALLSLHGQVYPTYPILSPLTVMPLLPALLLILTPMFIQG